MIAYDTAMHVFTTPGGHPATFHYRTGTNDWNTLWASLNEDEYQLPPVQSGVAVDVGGYLGSVGIALAIDNPDLRVIIVEPVPPNCELITRNILQNGVEDRVKLLAGAVGPKGTMVHVAYGYKGSEAAEHHAFVGNSTLLEQAEHHETVKYAATTLWDLVNLAGGHIPLLKIDTEGGEWDFLLPPATRNVELIVGEWHPVKGHVRDDLVDLIGKTHVVTFTGPKEGPGGFRAERR